MSSLKNIRNKIKSIRETQKITRSMELISNTKLKRIEKLAKNDSYQARILSYVLYSKMLSTQDESENLKIKLLHKNILNRESDLEFEKKKKFLFVVFTSEKGLCGSFNNVIMQNLLDAIKDIQGNEFSTKDFKLIIIGKKGYDILSEMNLLHYVYKYFNIEKYQENNLVQEISKNIIDLMSSVKFDKVFIYYFQFKNTLTQYFVKKQIFPLLKSDEDQKIFGNSNNLEFEGKNLIEPFLSLYIKSTIKYAILQNNASEHAARRSVMENATSNAGEIIDKLHLKLNKKRQALITTELIEIISGLEALLDKH